MTTCPFCTSDDLTTTTHRDGGGSLTRTECVPCGAVALDGVWTSGRDYARYLATCGRVYNR